MIAFYLIYFSTYSITTFLPKYFGEIGLTDAQIGVLMAVPTVAGVLLQPYWGILTDRAKTKRRVLAGLLLALSAACFVIDRLTGFAALLTGMTAYMVISLPISPAYTAIALEYLEGQGRPYGPVRLLGTVGFQIGALATGALLVGSLSGLFKLIGVIYLLSCLAACRMPAVAGHQHGRTKVPMRELTRDRHFNWLLLMVFIVSVTQQFYLSFFSKYMGDIGVGNLMTGAMLLGSVLLELPFLLFGDRLAKKLSVWDWLLIGFLLNAIRWIGLAAFQNEWLLVLAQIPAVSIMACFEFFPALYINRRVPDALKGSAQALLMLVAFGVSKVVGSLAGGVAAQWFGIRAVFGFNGALLIAAGLLLIPTVRRMKREEAETTA